MRRYRFVVTVTGSNPFPVDMLRYDAAFPRTEEDSHKIAVDMYSGGMEPRTVQVLTDQFWKHWTPAVDRWRSFGWRVDSWQTVE